MLFWIFACLACGSPSLFGLDAVVYCSQEELPVLETSLAALRRNCAHLGRLIVVSPECYSSSAEWVSTAAFPCHLEDAPRWVNFEEECDRQAALQEAPWYVRQLWKLYASRVIPGLSSSYLACDASVILLQPLPWIHQDGAPWQYLTERYHLPFFAHMQRLLPGLHRLIPGSAFGYAQIIDQAVVQRLEQEVQEVHHLPLWQAILKSIDPWDWDHRACSVAEILANLRKQMGLPSHYARLLWKPTRDLHDLEQARAAGLHLLVWENPRAPWAELVE